ncbi:hypothetical protein HGRIS_013643 [Hohenbuehelia grisea]|uniref:Coenzyme Q-binding protein COQ10 START domain-containing protein n=1 Tax=Hohenbuehelia grisea TaxID=104357 RepID=A0ABR3IW43_9AGAR
MRPTSTLFTALLFGPLLATCQSNLPPPSAGIFTAQASICIQAPIELAWTALLDFASYPKWNPFARSMKVANGLGVVLDDQTPQENRRLWIQAQIPPLEPPVNENTPPNVLHSQVSFENITTIDSTTRRASWRAIMLPDILLDAERWSALSVPNSSCTLYESREVFGSLVSLLVDLSMAPGLQKGFEYQAAEYKRYVEGLAI